MFPRFETVRRLSMLVVLGLTAPAWGEDATPVRIVRPLRQLELVTGETLAVEFLGLDEHGLDFRWQGRNRCRLPLAAIRSLSNPPGVIDHGDETFDAPPFSEGVWSAERDSSWHRDVATPLTAGELQLWYRVPAMTSSGDAIRLHAHFQNGELVLLLRGDGTVTVNPPSTWSRTFSQSLRSSTGWTRLTIRWDADRCEMNLDEAVHSAFRSEGAHLQGVTVEATKSGAGSMEIDDVVLRQVDDVAARRPFPAHDLGEQDVATLNTGDQLYGQFVVSTKSRGVTLRNPQGDWVGDWNDLQRLEFAKRPLPSHFLDPREGWCFDLQFPASSVYRVTREILRGVRITDQTLSHPWLGVLAWLPSSPVTLTPYGRGEFRWLEPGRHHLGDEIRPDLSPSRPTGTALSGSVTLETVPTTSTWIVVETAELEPSGPRTIPTQRFLEILRGGGLRTELLINDRVITDLNRFLSIRPSMAHPERLWLPVPAESWRAGKNTWAIRQRPLSPMQSQYDDSVIGRIGLWISQ